MVSSTADESTQTSAAATRIVGIGASAGGLAALEQFLEHVPPDSGLAYIVVQHLDPTQEAMLAELLQRATKMPVYEAADGASVKPDHVYVIPPNSELTVRNGRLHLQAPSEPRGLRLPVNILFSSLAGAQGDRAIAIVLSGMGSDGMLGMQAVKAVGGLTVVQQPDTAEFDSMPTSAIKAGCDDIVDAPDELPARILAYIDKVPDPAVSPVDEPSTAIDSPPLEDIFALLQERTRHDFSVYKVSTMHRRIQRRMAIHNLPTLERYRDLLRNNSQEIDLLFNELLIGVTSFFRDPDFWDHLADSVLPDLLARQATADELRAWVIGCSTGEEAYSLAMVFAEIAGRHSQLGGQTIKIFASDLSSDAIATARRGQYPPAIAEAIPADRLKRFFNNHGTHFQINKNIRDMVLFAHHDVVLDPPFTKLDLITCRNLLIYFDTALQRRLIPLFHYILRPGGVLALGTSETAGRFNHLFDSINVKLRTYLRRDGVANNRPDMLIQSYPPLSRARKESSVPSATKPDRTPDNLQTAADYVLLQTYAPAAVVVNGDGDIVYISGRTGNYLEPAAGKANWNFHAMVREGLRTPLANALKQAAEQGQPVQMQGLPVELSAGAQYVDVTVQAFHEPSALDGTTIIVFRDAMPAPKAQRRRGKQSTRDQAHAEEIQRYQNEVARLREESRASHEELQSTNEELQSTNEELQSANEELSTSKEEMQSMNEELQAINAELRTKLDDLALAQSDMQNVLNSIEIAILFLDNDLNVRRYTERAANIVNLRESDVGRPLSDLTSRLKYPTLHEDALEALRTLTASEKQIQTDDSRWFSIRIMPYRRVDNMIDGVVITLVDITETKSLESALRHESDGHGQ